MKPLSYVAVVLRDYIPKGLFLSYSRQRACTCHFFSVKGSLIPRPLTTVGRCDQINSKLGHLKSLRMDFLLLKGRE